MDLLEFLETETSVGTRVRFLVDTVRMYQYVALELRGIDPRPRRVLDVGCSIGYGSHLLSQGLSEARVIGVDVEEDKIRESGHLFGGTQTIFERVDFTDSAGVSKLLEREGNFDVVVCFEVLEHIPPRMTEAFLNNLRRALRSGGLLFLSTPNKRIYDIDAYSEGHGNEMLFDTLVQTLTTTGFSISEVLGIEKMSSFSATLLMKFHLVQRDGNQRVVLTKGQKIVRKIIASTLNPRATLEYLLSRMSKRTYYKWKFRTAINQRPEQSHVILVKAFVSKGARSSA